jgi:hypothetical protein
MFHAFNGAILRILRVFPAHRALQRAFETAAADRDRLMATLWSVADPLDSSRFRLDMTTLLASQRDAAADALWESWQAMFERGEYDLALQSVLKSSRMRIAQHGEADCYKPFAAYYLASILAALGDFEGAAPYVEMINFDAPPEGADLLPYALRQSGRLARCRQDIAIEKGTPGALIVSLPRSASASLVNSIAATFAVPLLTVCIGEGLRSMVVRRWAAQVARGGAVTHEHFRAVPQNLAALRDAGVHILWVQVRDPRDAAFSLARMREDYERIFPPEPDHASDDSFVRDCQLLANWINEWIDARDRHNINVEFVFFSEATNDFEGTLAKMFPESVPSRLAPHKTNFRLGTGGEWRMRSTASQQRAWAVIPADVKTLLKLER